MSKFTLTINRQRRTVDVDPDTPLLWLLRDTLELTGTKYGCGMGICGACTILQGSDAVRSCQITAADAAGKSFTTIEGLRQDPCQRAWVEEDVAQCGYCQPGMLMTACALLKRTPRPTDQQIDEAFDDNVCRCGTYPRIRLAVHRAAGMVKS